MPTGLYLIGVVLILMQNGQATNSGSKSERSEMLKNFSVKFFGSRKAKRAKKTFLEVLGTKKSPEKQLWFCQGFCKKEKNAKMLKSAESKLDKILLQQPANINVLCSIKSSKTHSLLNMVPDWHLVQARIYGNLQIHRYYDCPRVLCSLRVTYIDIFDDVISTQQGDGEHLEYYAGEKKALSWSIVLNESFIQCLLVNRNLDGLVYFGT